ncbi:MAG: hypothetical protein R2699_03190 [Acidimicrobiales bacterium]
MPSYLSAAWIAALGEAVAGSDDLLARRRRTSRGRLRGHRRRRGRDVPRPAGAGRLQCRAGRRRRRRGVHADRATAVAIARGDLRAQRAFMAGRIQLSGDVSALLDRADALAVLTTIQPPPTDQE